VPWKTPLFSTLNHAPPNRSLTSQPLCSLVLVVDDDPELLSGLRRSLRPWAEDFEFLFICGGAAELQTLHRRRVDVIVTGLLMPIIQGQSLISEGRKLRPHSAFIALSGNANAETVEKLTEAHIVYLAKPVTAETLMTAVEDSIDWLDTRS
jgi:DNA-binding NtrC family response regulator